MTTTRPFHVLFVCAGNTARSPFAAACARHQLSSVDEGTWRVASAGTSVMEGASVTEESLRLAAEFGFDLSGHQVRTVTADECRRADLIIAMGWDQATAVWSLVPDSWDRCFTLKEFLHYSRRATSKPAILYADRADHMRDRVKATHELRRRARTDHGFWGDMRPQDFDLPEPEGASPQGWSTYARAVKLLVADSMRLLAGSGPGPNGSARKVKPKATAGGSSRPRSARRSR